ncbi:hypothetical protein NVP3058O_068 [Vibrio phage 3.058.O._10N.286.46.B8]|nr:hypothetical protein NVP2058O_069 [Vibrio phage 2.058.O._10N.286.46.B8]AUS03138.1 hypothetical protein NVP3058O_068 [Vibrio phage 3.058.O._10N.286.46.B8]
MRAVPSDVMVGTKHQTKHCGELEIIDYINAKNIRVKFVATGYEGTTQAVHIRRGSVRDVLAPTVRGVGYIGIGKYKPSESRIDNPEYILWRSILQRCYSKEFQIRAPTYIGCSVHTDWLNYQNFAEFYHKNYVDGYHLDKDLLVIGNKQYGPNTCVFVPHWLNTFVLNGGSSSDIGSGFNASMGKYVCRCHDMGEIRHIGYFETSEDAHTAWLDFKLGLALKHKPEIDAIDCRLYQNTVSIINTL